MHMLDIIRKKRDGGVLSREEISFFIQGYATGQIPDYQASALLMAIFFRDINKEETLYFTEEMMHSGDVMNLSEIPGIKVDKHSTGGVGDKTTFVVAPICAACGVPVAKMSGRGLGFTGGTVDKLESIPGMKTTLEKAEFLGVVKKAGMCVIGQSSHIAVADKKLYALRDVTGTVANRGLITSSIMSKKLASGSDAIVLDVKYGNGAFIKKREDAVVLAEWMVEIGKRANKKMAAFITDMQQPLGLCVGNSIEVMEAIDTLKGKGPSDITELGVKLAGYMVFIGGKANTYESGIKKAENALKSKSALHTLESFILAQGGNSEVVRDYSIFPQSRVKEELIAEKGGYVCELSAEAVGKASQLSGAGREKKEDEIDLAAGIVLKKKIGDRVEVGDVLAEIHSSNKNKSDDAKDMLASAYVIENNKPEKRDIIYKIID